MADPDNILIVDDNPNNLQVLSGILATEGFKVRPALSGESALRAVEVMLPSLILLDVRMPGMDGYETCRRLKAKVETRDIPVLFISALNEMEDKLQAFRTGAVDYITKPFQAEEVLARVHTQMELAKTRKALEATNARLLAMLDQLVQAEKLKSLKFLAAGFAHELNTPIGNASLVADTIDTSVREYFSAKARNVAGRNIDELLNSCQDGAAFIIRNLDRAITLINSMKEMTVDRASERRRTVNLHKIVSDVLTMTRLQFNDGPYTFSDAVDKDLTLETYPGHVEQILENLIQNAVIHGFDGAPSGAVVVSGQRTPDGQIELSVADNGHGIPVETLKNVFDPFFTTKMGQGGSGLGLHISHTLATGILGGHIGVTSIVNSGTNFTLRLPLIAPDASPPSGNMDEMKTIPKH